eukprot:GHUV01056221.1.p1 GENE.GHUV01056221.1~~GHUV01056221.1.p1  ORF type:complete len:167 (+),score=30.04 GHUV01056221.1:61-501(+)
MEQAPQHPLAHSNSLFLRWPNFGDMPVLVISTMVRANEIELRIKHTSRTGILPPVSFTQSDDQLKMRDAKKAQVKPEFHICLRKRKCSERLEGIHRTQSRDASFNCGSAVAGQPLCSTGAVPSQVGTGDAASLPPRLLTLAPRELV